MRKLVFIVLLLCGSCFATPAYVQSNIVVDFFGTSNLTEAVQFASNVTAGNLIHVWVGWFNIANTVTGVADNCGNSYTQIGSTLTDSNGSYAQFYMLNAAGGSRCTVTATFGGSAFTNKILAITEASGVKASTALDASVQLSTGGSGTDGMNSGNMTTTADGDLIICSTWSTGLNAVTITGGTGYTLRATSSSAASSTSSATEDKVQSVHGAIACTFTTSGFDSGAVAGAAFKAVVGNQPNIGFKGKVGFKGKIGLK